MDRKRLLTPDELAKELGVERSTVLRLVRQRRIPAVKFTKKIVRFDRDAVLKAMTTPKANRS
jgi:excisionase family DNA binding protein